MLRKILPLILLILFIGFFIMKVNIVYSQTPTPTSAPDSGKLQELQNKIKELEGKISDLQGQEKTLSSQIAVMDSQIKLTQFRIDSVKQQLLELEVDIDTTNKKITNLEKNLSELTEVLINRIVATYKVGSSPPFQILLSADNMSNFFSRLNYLKIAQAHDKKLVYDTQQAKMDYSNQKDIFEDKKAQVQSLKKQLEGYTAQLSQEQKIKKDLLSETKGSEANFQRMLAQARAEYQAIQGIVSGYGNETEAGPVSEGQTIASVISGSSCNSGGTHLHFIVIENGGNQNPFNYLSSISSENCSGSSCGSSDGDPFSPSGSWRWPLDGPIKLYQGYGSTWATRNTWVKNIYSFHNGIDIEGSSLSVKAVKNGTLYRGSYSVGCPLNYVKIVHSEGNFVTYYLHVY